MQTYVLESTNLRNAASRLGGGCSPENSASIAKNVQFCNFSKMVGKICSKFLRSTCMVDELPIKTKQISKQPTYPDSDTGNDPLEKHKHAFIR